MITDLCDICSEEVLTSLASKPEVLAVVKELLVEIHNYLSGLGLMRGKDYTVELSEWVDIEFEDWRKTQITIKLSSKASEKLSKSGMNDFKILNNILDHITKTTPKEKLAEVLITIE